MAEFLDLVALGTVADLVRLDRNNRILVQQGLRRIRAGLCCPGVTALLQVAGRKRERVTAADLGFAVGPRLNAAGRLEDMSRGIECLLSDDPVTAQELAGTLDGLNRERQGIESDMKDQADDMMKHLKLSATSLPLGLCLYDTRWHQGVIGILASRIKESYHRPVVAFAPGDADMLRGSARSIPGLHIRDVLAALDSRYPGLLQRFGGHAMAAGLSLSRDRLEDFSVAFVTEVERQLDGCAPAVEVFTDGPLAPGEINAENARVLRYAGPWGQGFPEPLFDGEFQVLSQRIVGDVHLKLELSLDRARQVDAIAFRWGADTLTGNRVHLAYRLDLNEYRGVERPQLIIEHLEPL
jgi:single-stranded-DNA-specific exonuclease